jgi:hypothetical protein
VSGFGAIADHDALAEGPLRPWGKAVKGILAPASVIWAKQE